MNGAVSRRVSAGSVTTTFQRSASSGFARSGAFASKPASSPCSASFSAIATTCSSSQARPSLSHIAVASSRVSRSPSTSSSSAYMSGPSCTIFVVTDHAENLGLAPMIAESNPDLLKTAFGRKVHDLVRGGNRVKPMRPGARLRSRATIRSRGKTR